MESHYEINVSLHGRHLFATHPRSARDKRDMEILRGQFRARFPESEGFRVTVTHWKASGQTVED